MVPCAHNLSLTHTLSLTRTLVLLLKYLVAHISCANIQKYPHKNRLFFLVCVNIIIIKKLYHTALLNKTTLSFFWYFLLTFFGYFLGKNLIIVQNKLTCFLHIFWGYFCNKYVSCSHIGAFVLALVNNKGLGAVSLLIRNLAVPTCSLKTAKPENTQLNVNIWGYFLAKNINSNDNNNKNRKNIQKISGKNMRALFRGQLPPNRSFIPQGG